MSRWIGNLVRRTRRAAIGNLWNLWYRIMFALGTVYPYSDLVVIFSEALDPATVTNVGDGTGSFELYDQTGEAWVAGSLSTVDNITWTFNPTAELVAGQKYTLVLADTIAATSGRLYSGLDGIITVVADTTAPTLSDVTAGDTQNTITFSSAPGNGIVDSFNLYWSLTPSQAIGSMTKIAGVISPYVHGSLTNDTAYYYKVTAVRSGVESDPSTEVSGTPTAAAVVFDTFTDTDSTLLTAHTPDIGVNSWVATQGTWSVTGNKASHSQSANHDTALIESAVADCTVSAIINLPSTAEDGGLFLRSDGTVNNGIFVRLYKTSGKVDLYKVVAGAFILINQGSLAIVADTDYLVAVAMSGTNITVNVDGVTKASGTITEHATNTIHGLRAYSNKAVTWDDFAVEAA